MKILNPQATNPAPLPQPQRGKIVRQSDHLTKESRSDHSAVKVSPQPPRGSSSQIKKINVGVLPVCLAAVVVVVLAAAGVREVNRIRDEMRTQRILTMVQEGVPSDIIFDRVSLEGNISLVPFIRPKRESATPVEQVMWSAPQRKRTPQQLVSEVQRIIGKTNKRHRDSRRLAMAIVAEAARQNFDPLFTAAVIKSESSFNETAVSHKGAQGLMQIMPATGRYLGEKHNLGLVTTNHLKDASLNLRLGIAYLKQLENSYEGNRLLTLIAYNWGPGKLDRAIKSGRGVPAECLRYALKILRDHNLWQSEGTIPL